MSFLATQLVGFGAGASGGVETLIDRTLGTNIGTFTTNGGLASIFDGTTNQGFGVSGVATSSPSYAGKTHGAAKIFSRATVYGSNDAGFSSSNGSCTLDVYGKNGAAPSGPTDGTIIGTVTFTDTSNESAGRSITSTDTSTAYLHWWVTLTGATNHIMSEIVWYELV